MSHSFLSGMNAGVLACEAALAYCEWLRGSQGSLWFCKNIYIYISLPSIVHSRYLRKSEEKMKILCGLSVAGTKKANQPGNLVTRNSIVQNTARLEREML